MAFELRILNPGNGLPLLELNTTLLLAPADRSYVYDLIADCRMTKGDRAMTIFYFQRAIETDPTNKNVQDKFGALKVGGR